MKIKSKKNIPQTIGAQNNRNRKQAFLFRCRVIETFIIAVFDKRDNFDFQFSILVLRWQYLQSSLLEWERSAIASETFNQNPFSLYIKTVETGTITVYLSFSHIIYHIKIFKCQVYAFQELF